jgi:hypothetical protein
MRSYRVHKKSERERQRDEKLLIHKDSRFLLKNLTTAPSHLTRQNDIKKNDDEEEEKINQPQIGHHFSLSPSYHQLPTIN